MKYAVIKLQGKQYKLTEGEQLTVDLLDVEDGKTFDVDEVLLVVEDGKENIGTPLVKGAKVTLKALESGKGEKIRVFKYKSKSKYRKTIGHRQKQTTVQVEKITV
jgi:large subunit ribosomal protein L21